MLPEAWSRGREIQSRGQTTTVSQLLVNMQYGILTSVTRGSNKQYYSAQEIESLANRDF